VIASVEGVVGAVAADSLVIEVGGIGYRVFAAPSILAAAQPGSRLKLHTYHLVREDQQALYGFRSAEELGFFNLLLTVTGVGPKVALAIVSGYSPGELRRAIVREDADLFQTIPGIGKKTAQRVVLELRERIAPLAAVEGPHLRAGDGHVVARDALVELGYSLAEAEKRLAETDPDLSPAERVREALRAA
jgi:Holliday junction DNA helicase RuvA